MTIIPLSATLPKKTWAKKPKVDEYEVVRNGVPMRYPRVTSICDMEAKGYWFERWIATTNSEAAFKACVAVYEEQALSTPLSVDAFVALAKERMGEQRADEKIMEAAADIGKNVHDYIQWFVHQEKKEWLDVVEPKLLTPESRQAVEAWLAWWSPMEKEALFIEEQVVNDEWQYAGREDWKGWLEGRLLDVDWKTASGIYESSLRQNGAYSHAVPYSDAPFQRSEGGMIVRLPKKAGDKPDYTSPEWCRTLSRDEQDHQFKLFCYLRELFRDRNGR